MRFAKVFTFLPNNGIATAAVRVMAWTVGSVVGYFAWAAFLDAIWDEPGVSSAGTQFNYALVAVLPIWIVAAVLSGAIWRYASQSRGLRLLRRSAADATAIAFVGVPAIAFALIVINFTPDWVGLDYRITLAQLNSIVVDSVGHNIIR